MARLKCTNCDAGVLRADVSCRRCGASLLGDGATAEAPEPSQRAEDTVTTEIPPPSRPLVSSPSLRSPASEPAAPAPDQCPYCGAGIPDPRHLVCLECMKELSPRTAPAALQSLSPPATDGRNPYSTMLEQGGTRLEVSFAFGKVEVSMGEELLIGRDATEQHLASLEAMRNVSRRHATIGLTPRGAWVRDEKSANGTYVNGRLVEAGETADLPEGAELRLASNVKATVRYRRAGEADHG